MGLQGSGQMSTGIGPQFSHQDNAPSPCLPHPQGCSKVGTKGWRLNPSRHGIVFTVCSSAQPWAPWGVKHSDLPQRTHDGPTSGGSLGNRLQTCSGSCSHPFREDEGSVRAQKAHRLHERPQAHNTANDRVRPSRGHRGTPCPLGLQRPLVHHLEKKGFRGP